MNSFFVVAPSSISNFPTRGPGGTSSKKEKKNPPANAGDVRDMDSTPGLGRSPGEGHGNSLQFYCLEIPMDIGT